LISSSRNVKSYNGSDSKDFLKGGTFFSSKPECQQAAQEADNALGLDPEERIKQLVVAMDTSSEEEEEEESMDGCYL
jgi:DNA mismatch repair protein MSH6